MKKALVVALVVALAAVAAIACSDKSGCMGGAEDACSPPIDSKCYIDSDCHENEICDYGSCLGAQTCVSDNDCSLLLLYCSETLHRCEYLPYCKADSDCTTYGSGLVCDSVTRYCIHAAADGDTDAESEESSEAASE